MEKYNSSYNIFLSLFFLTSHSLSNYYSKIILLTKYVFNNLVSVKFQWIFVVAILVLVQWILLLALLIWFCQFKSVYMCKIYLSAHLSCMKESWAARCQRSPWTNLKVEDRKFNHKLLWYNHESKLSKTPPPWSISCCRITSQMWDLYCWWNPSKMLEQLYTLLVLCVETMIRMNGRQNGWKLIRES